MPDRILKIPVESAYDINNITDNKRTKVIMYVYALPKLNDAKYFMGEAVQTFLNYSTAPLDRSTIEAYGDEQITLMVASMEGSAAVGDKGKQLVSYATLTSKQWVKHDLAKIELGNNGSIEPLMATINKPFDLADYQAGKQLLFIVSNVDIIKEASENARVIDKDGEYNIELTNIEAFKTGSKFSQITPYVGEIGDVINDLKITIPNTTIFQRINGKGVVNGRETDLSFTTTAKLMPFKHSPISTDQNLSVFADWFDYDLAMPFFVAKLFASPQPLSVLKNIKIGNQSVIDDTDIQSILNMLAQATGYANSWADISRYTGNEANDAGKGNAGRLLSYTTVGDLSLGRPNVRISTLENADPIKTIDGVYESYLRNNVNKEETLASKIVKQVIASLSRYIPSSYSVGKGQNAFNKIYLPWTLKPLDAINLSEGAKKGDGITTEKQYILKPDVKFQITSNYFNVNANNITPLNAETNVSEVKVIQTDRKITLPTIPLQVQPISKLPLAGDIDTTSDKDLRYFAYIPLKDNTNIAKFMAENVSNATGTNTTITRVFNNYLTEFNTDPTKPYDARPLSEIISIVKADVLAKYLQLGIKDTNIVVDTANISYPSKLTTFPVLFNVYWNTIADGSINLVFVNRSTGKTAIKNIGSVYGTRDVTNEVLSTFIGNSADKTTFEAHVIGGPDTGFAFTAHEAGGTAASTTIANVENTRLDFTMSKIMNIQQINVSKLTIDNFPDISFGYERNAVFNKSSWYNEIANTFGVENIELPLKEVQKLPINKIHSLTVSGFYGNKVGVDINNVIRLEGNNPFEFDETISQFTMIFC